MLYNLNGKNVKIPDNEINKLIKNHSLSKDDAIQVWLEDEGYLENEEMEFLTQKAKENKVISTIHQASAVDKTKKQSKPKTVKVSDEKKELFDEIYTNLTKIYGENAQIVKENKLITVEVGEKSFKIDVIETRPPKK